jgi:hypothetical protein
VSEHHPWGLVAFSAGVSASLVATGMVFLVPRLVHHQTHSAVNSPSTSVTTPVVIPSAVSPSPLQSIASSSPPPAPPVPTLAWTLLARDYTAGDLLRFRSQVRGSSQTEAPVIQRMVGTGHTWVTVGKVNSGGNGATVAVPVGQQSFRLAVVYGRTVVANTSPQVVYGYATMPLREVFSTDQEKPVVIASTSFKYVWAPNLDSFEYVHDAQQNALINVTHSPCRSLSLRFGASKDEPLGVDRYNMPDTVQIVREAADPVARRVGPETFGDLTVTLGRGQSWGLTLSGSYYIYFNGTGSCYKPLGLH